MRESASTTNVLFVGWHVAGNKEMQCVWEAWSRQGGAETGLWLSCVCGEGLQDAYDASAWFSRVCQPDSQGGMRSFRTYIKQRR